MLKRYLLAPGPTPVPPRVLQSMALPILHHRAPDFVPILDSAKKGLKRLYQTENDVLILTSTGTGGMVAAVNNFFSPGERVLVVNGGKFGERWTNIGRAYGLEVTEIEVPWGHAVKPEQVEQELARDGSIKGVLIQGSETSTGVFHDIRAVGEVLKRHPEVLYVVDAISALVAHDIKTDGWGIDVMVAGSQKGLMLPPGLAFISVSERAWKKAEAAEAPHFYFNLKKERAALAKNQTNFTSSVTLVVALNEALKLLEAEGYGNVFARHARLAEATRAAAKALGLSLFAKESPSNALTAVETPAGIDGQEVYKRMREDYGITGAGGQDQARGKIFRIAHLGYADTFDVITAVAGLEMVLRGLGHDLALGSGVAAAQEILMVK
jgi:aspartate aminotransferase-like enzyme